MFSLISFRAVLKAEIGVVDNWYCWKSRVCSKYLDLLYTKKPTVAKNDKTPNEPIPMPILLSNDKSLNDQPLESDLVTTSACSVLVVVVPFTSLWPRGWTLVGALIE